MYLLRYKIVTVVLILMSIMLFSCSMQKNQTLEKLNIKDSEGNIWLSGLSAKVMASNEYFCISDDRYKCSWTYEPADDVFGKQQWKVLNAVDSKGILDLRWYIRTDNNGVILAKLSCVNRSDKPLNIEQLIVLEGFRPGDWEGGRVLNFGVEGVSLLKKGIKFGGIFATATNKPSFTGAFLSTSHYQGIVNVTATEGGLKVEAINPADGVLLQPGKSRESEPVWMSSGVNPSNELERWAKLTGKWNNVRTWPKNVAALCTWYSGMNDNRSIQIDGLLERFTYENLPLLAEKLKPLGLETVRVVDDTVERMPGDWPLKTQAIPGGYEKLALETNKYGFTAGFWYDSHRVLEKSKLFSEHPDWLAKNTDGRPLVIPNTAYGAYGILDASVNDACNYYTEVANRFRNTGLRNVFTDFASETALAPSHSHNPELTSVEITRRALTAIRKGLGDDFYYLGQRMSAGMIGIMDAFRTTDDGWGQNIATYRQALSKWFLNRNVILCDTDAWCPLMHDIEWDRNWGSWQVLTGGPMTLGIALKPVGELAAPRNDFTQERYEMIQRLMPPLSTTGRPRDLWERDEPMVLEQSIQAAGQKWRVVGIFNYKAIPQTVKLNLDRLWDESKFDELGLCGNLAKLGKTQISYLVYDFWPQKFVGVCNGMMEFKMEAMSGRVIVIREYMKHPQIISIGTHIGQGIEELKGCVWNQENKKLTLTTQGRCGLFDTDIRLHVPQGWTVESVTADGRALDFNSATQICYFTVPDRKKTVDTQVCFGGKSNDNSKIFRPVEPNLILESYLSINDSKKVKDGLAAVWAKQLTKEMLLQIPEGYESVFFACRHIDTLGGGLTAVEYQPAVGFGLVQGDPMRYIYFEKDRPRSCDLWLNSKSVIYRIDGLNSTYNYKLGVTLINPGSPIDPGQIKSTSLVDVYAVCAGDGRKFKLAEGVVKPNMPEIYWYQVPQEAIDSKGVLLEVQSPGGNTAGVINFWMVRKL